MAGGTAREFSPRMIYRNATVLRDIIWMGSLASDAGEVVRDFLAGECDLMKLQGTRHRTLNDLQIFLNSASGRPICVERSRRGDLLVRAIGSGESLLLTGRTADVIRAYLDRAPVRMQDRADMTIRRR